MAEVLSPHRTDNWTALANEHARMKLEDYWGRFRGVGPRGWHPSIEFEGDHYIRKALENGKGAVIWCMRFSSDAVLKQGFYQAGLPLVHLRDSAHGAHSGRTRLGTSLVSPLFCRAEDPYLASRVVIPVEGSLGYLQTLRDHLRANDCVSIYGDATGRQTVEVPFLTGTCKYATGAPSMAWAEDSPLFSAYALRTGRFKYRVIVEDAIAADRSLPRKAFVSAAVAEFAQRVERLVRNHPTDWQDWLLWKQSQA
jgi:hypothetical protein